MNSNNNVNHYVALTIFLLVFCMTAVYYKPSSTNIEIHINRLIPRRLGVSDLRKRSKALNELTPSVKQDDKTFLKFLKNLKLRYTASSSTELIY